MHLCILVFVVDGHRKSLFACVHLCVRPPGFHYPLYGKTAGREESEVTPPGRGGAVSSKQSGDSSSSSAMELLQQQSHQYHGKSPA
ncbi:zinc finger protein 608, partial [Lates japonicus]